MAAGLNETRVQQYIEDIQRLWTLPDRRVFRILKKLENEARASGDDRLSGYAYFHYANAHYSRNEQDEAHIYVRKAIQHLMRSDDEELLARTFNLFALDAQFAGCYDIAQNYFNMGYSLVSDNDESLVRAILEANLGNLMTEIGDHANAIRHTRIAATVVRRHSADVLSDQNLAVAYLNIGLNTLNAGEIKKAESALQKAEKILAGAEVEETIQMTLLLLRANFAFSTGETDALQDCVEELASRICNKTIYNDFVYDFYSFVQRLLHEGGVEYAGVLIDAIETVDDTGCSAYRRLLLAELVVEYYMIQGNKRRLNNSFVRQHLASIEQKKEKKKMQLYSVELMIQLNHLKEEQDRIREENERLKDRAETDPLTKLPNRHALNKSLEAAHARMLAAKQSMGISILDIDNFKQYNDLYGHEQGDRCLCQVADVLRRAANEHGIFVSRYGGDEFVIIYENRSDREIEKIIEELRLQMSVSVSHGFCNTVPNEESKLYDLLANADANMYRKKKERG